jgi:hypothetical protein
MSLSLLCSGSSVKMIDDCSFCRCRGVSCVLGVRMIDDCLFGRCRGVSCVSIILTPRTQETPRHLQNKQSSIILTELPEHKKHHDIYKTNNHLSS